MPITAENYEDILNYHAPEEDQIARFAGLRSAAKAFVFEILAATPVCADQQAAIRKVREALFTANAAVALRGRG